MDLQFWENALFSAGFLEFGHAFYGSQGWAFLFWGHFLCWDLMVFVLDCDLLASLVSMLCSLRHFIHGVGTSDVLALWMFYFYCLRRYIGVRCF